MRGDYKRKILELIREKGAITPKEISETTGINYNTVRGVLYRLLKAGLIRRRKRGLYEPV